jgi:hypothetical protein
MEEFIQDEAIPDCFFSYLLILVRTPLLYYHIYPFLFFWSSFKHAFDTWADGSGKANSCPRLSAVNYNGHYYREAQAVVRQHTNNPLFIRMRQDLFKISKANTLESVSLNDLYPICADTLQYQCCPACCASRRLFPCRRPPSPNLSYHFRQRLTSLF